jgi:LacI family transcriptional regulator
MNTVSAPRVSLRSIAEHLGVSVMTVSRALRARPEVAADTREKITLAAEKLGYRPDARMKELMAHIRSSDRPALSGTLAYLRGCAAAGQPTQNVETNRLHLAGAKRRAEAAGYRLFVADLPFDGSHDARLHRVLRARGVGGVIIYPPEGLGLNLTFDTSGYSTVALGTTIATPAIHRVTGNERSAMLVCLREARLRGYRRPGLVMDRLADLNTDHEWLPAFLTHQHFLPRSSVVPVCTYRDWTETPQREVIAWYRRHKPDIVLSTDADTLRWLRASGVSIPGDCGFMQLCLPEPVRRASPAGTVQNSEAVGALLVDKLIAQILRGEKGLPSLVVDSFVEASWVEGGTVRPRALEK